MSQATNRSATPDDSPPTVSAADIYREACASMRATDEISLKLLAAVPLVTGVGITLLVREPSKDFPGPARFAVALFGAVVTFAIYRWERKNIKDCTVLRSFVATLEKEHIHAQPKLTGPPHEHGPGVKFLWWWWGKTEAERLLYSAVIVSWLATGLYALWISLREGI